MNIANTSSYGIDGFGAYFGDDTIDTIVQSRVPLVYLTPQVINSNTNVIIDTLNWVLITGTFVATGNEKHALIGNFKSDLNNSTSIVNSNYLPAVYTDVCVDDVSCIDIDLPAYAGPDVWGAPTTTVYLGRESDVGIDEACMWYKLPNTTTAIDTAAGITATVGVTTDTYVVRQEICGNVKWDTVTVNISGVGLSSHVTLSGVEGAVENNIRIYPNPSDKELTIETKQYKGEEFSLKILNGLGQTLREEDILFKDNTISIQTSELKNGIYFLKLSNSKLGSVRKRFVIAR